MGVRDARLTALTKESAMDLHRRPTWFDLARHEDPPTPAAPAPAPPVPAPPAEPPAPPADDETSLPDKVKEVLRKEREARKEAEAKAKAGEAAAKRLAEIEEAQKTEQQKLEDRAAAAEKAAAEANEKLLRAEVAIAKGLPPALAARLVGSDRASMEADADALLALVPPAPTPPAPPGSAGVGAVGDPPAPTDFRTAEKADVDAELRRLGVRRL